MLIARPPIWLAESVGISKEWPRPGQAANSHWGAPPCAAQMGWRINSMDDYLLEVAQTNQDQILTAYNRFEQHKPIVLIDIQEQRLYVYPYQGFLQELNPRNQDSLRKQYETASAENKIVVFVRDNVKRKLVSYSFDNE
jgi:hypothetical protein